MGAFVSYSLITGIVMMALFLAYRLFMAGENLHAYNRGVILSIYALSFLSWPTMRLIEQAIAACSSTGLSLEGVALASTEGSPETSPLWAPILIWIYIIGMAAVSIKTLFTWLRLIHVVRSGQKLKRNGYTLVITEDSRLAPFSWLGYVVVNRKDYEDDGFEAVIVHEKMHVDSHHWIDLWIAQMVCVVQWFNPAAWLLREELMLVHEYQADMAVIDSGFDPQEYQLLLIKKAVGSRFPSLANSLNHSKLKKRITMMYKQKSGGGRKFKALALVPMLAISLGIAAVPAVQAAVITISSSSVSGSKVNENLANGQPSSKVFKVVNINKDGDKTALTINGTDLGNSLTVSGGTITANGKTYDANGLQCNMTDGTAVIKAVFPSVEDWEKASLTLNVNGKDIVFNLDDFLANAQTVEVNNGSTKPAKIIVINGENSMQVDAMEISIDGKKVTKEEMDKLPSDKIQSIDVNRQNNTIKIVLKK